MQACTAGLQGPSNMRTWVAHLIHAGMRSTHSPYAVSSRAFTLVLRAGRARARKGAL